MLMKTTLLTYSIFHQQISRIFAKDISIFMPVKKWSSRHKQVKRVYYSLIFYKIQKTENRTLFPTLHLYK